MVHDKGPAAEPEWCATVNGRHGVWSIFKSWKEASEFFLGSPGALLEKFETQGEALAFLEHHHHVGDEEVVASPSGLRPKLGKHKPEIPVDAQDHRRRPPMVLTGPINPSAKKSDEVFGADLGSKMELSALLPPNLPAGVSKSLANTMADATVTPGGFRGVSAEEDSNEMTLLGEAMEELVSQGQGQTDGGSLEGRSPLEKQQACIAAPSLEPGHALQACHSPP